MSCFMKDWVREQGQIQIVSVTLTTTPALIIPADPMRWSIMLPATRQTNVVLGFDIGGLTAGQFQIAPQSSWVYVSEDDIGDLVKRPVSMWVAAGPQLVVYATISYNPERKAKYDAWIERRLSEQ